MAPACYVGNSRNITVTTIIDEGRHIKGKFENVPLIFFATYNDRGGFAVQFELCSIKWLWRYGCSKISKLFNFSAIPLHDIPIGADQHVLTFALGGYV